MNLKTAAAHIEVLALAGIPLMMWGPPGVGKSDAVDDFIAKMTEMDGERWGLVDFRCSTRDTVALMGIPDISGDTTRWKVPDEFPQVKRDGKRGVLFLDEINAAPPSMMAALYGLVLDRKVGDYTLPPGWIVLAAGNRASDRAAAQRMPSALANRFAHIDIDPDLDTWVEWANKTDKDPMVVSFLRFRPDLLHNMTAVNGSDLRAFPTPRAWATVAKIVNSPPAMRQSLVASIVGDGAASEIEGFIRLYKELPSVKSILADPETTKVPAQASARFAVSGALARKVDSTTFAAAYTYIKRLPPEFQILFVMDAVKRDDSLSYTQTFITWADANSDVILGN